MTENSDSDLYDDILCQDRDNNVSDSDIDINDLYDNIHNPEVAETALNKVEVLTNENDKLRKQNSKLKDQITFLQILDVNGNFVIMEVVKSHQEWLFL